MADMELVIKISEGLKNDFESEQWTALSCMEMKNALEKATPLPKGHGRIGDLDALDESLREQQKSYEHTFGIRQPINEAVRDGIIIARCHIDHAPTIIEADKEQEDDKERND